MLRFCRWLHAKAAAPTLALFAVVLLLSVADAAFAQGSTYPSRGTGTNWTSTIGALPVNTAYNSDDIPGGASSSTAGHGSHIDEALVSVDYGRTVNIAMARFTPALAAVGIGAMSIGAAKAALRFVMGAVGGRI